jgi:hypothetical protein
VRACCGPEQGINLGYLAMVSGACFLGSGRKALIFRHS